MLPVVRLVVADVTSGVPRFVDREDLVAAGLLGLTQAARSYQPERGVSFQVFARTRIRGAVLDELRGRDRLSRAARRRVRQVTAASLFLHSAFRRPPTDVETANYLEVEVAVVRLAHDDVARAIALDGSTTQLDDGDVADRNGDGAGGPLAELLDAELRGYLVDAVAALPERLRLIVVAHFFDDREMLEIATELGVTASRVSQLCGRAVSMLRDCLNAQLNPDQVEASETTTGLVARRRHDYHETVAAASSVTTRLDRGRAGREVVAAA
jgi:RNA polymerase sigma factor for flagellar operon FliA